MSLFLKLIHIVNRKARKDIFFMTKRTYRSIKGYDFRNTIKEMKLSGKPCYFIKLDTTGLNRFRHRVVGFHLMEALFEGDHLVSTGRKKFVIMNPGEEFLSDYTSKYTGIAKEDILNGEDPFKAFRKIMQILGENFNLIGFNIDDFLFPFLQNCGFWACDMPYVGHSIDLMLMALSTMEPTQKFHNYQFKTIAKYFGADEPDVLDQMLNVFNHLIDLIPTGKNDVQVENIRRWKPSQGSSVPEYMIVKTNCGEISYNLKTMYWHETTDSIFDTIDINTLNEKICQKYGLNDIKEIAQVTC